MQSKYERNQFFGKKIRVVTDANAPDRFIPSRSTDEEMGVMQAKLQGSFDKRWISPLDEQLTRGLFGMSYRDIQQSSLLGFKQKPSVSWVPRPRETKPFKLEQIRVLDAPDISVDYYHNVLCWDKIIYIGLDTDLWGYDPALEQTNLIFFGNMGLPITAVACNNGFIMRTSADQTLRVIDETTSALVRLYQDNVSYTCVVPQHDHSFYMLSKDDRRLSIYDTRVPDPMPQLGVGDADALFLGLAFHSASNKLALSTERQVFLYDIRNLGTPLSALTAHNPPSKAISISKSGRYCATGGGKADRQLKVWDISTGGNIVVEADVGAQVCNIHWMDDSSLFVTEGYGSNNKISCWNVNDVALTRNTSSESNRAAGEDQEGYRVLYSAQNPVDPNSFATASTDETLRFWKVKKPSSRKCEPDPFSAFSSCAIR